MTMLWDQTSQLPKDAFKHVEQRYEECGFYLDVRLHLAAFVESKFLSNNEVDDATATNLANQLMTQFEAKIAAIPNEPDKFLSKSKLQDMYDNLKKNYASNLVLLYRTVRNCLEQERQIVASYSVSSTSMAEDGFPASGEGKLSTQIRQQIEILNGKIAETGVDLDRCKQDQENFRLEYYKSRESNAKFQSMEEQLGPQNPEVKKQKQQLDAMNNSIRTKYINLTDQCSALSNSYKQITANYKEVQHIVLEKELIQWKREQQLAGNGFNMNAGQLEVIQEWCENLAHIIWSMRQQVKQLQQLREGLGHQQGSPNDQDLMVNITECLTNLVTGTFIIEKQPPQVMKTNTRFTSTVRLLVGGALNVHMAAPPVSVSIVSENQANQLLLSNSTPKRKEDFNSGDILNGTGTMEYQNSTRQVSVTFRNLQLKKIRRTEKKGTESVMDEKFSVIFWTDFTIGELRFQLWTMSLPVVVIVHGNQEPQALATVVWDNAFGDWGRKPFVVPDKVTWGQVGRALSMKWAHACGKDLSEDNLYYLACKAFRNNNLRKDMDEINNLSLSWPLFCKENLSDRNFTFWEWFYRILILTQSHMQKLWAEGLIMGFVTKQDAEALLLTKPSGTFLLRFSDSELGGVTIAYVRNPDPYQGPSVFMVAPFTTRNLSQRCMADVIFDLNDLHTLFPDTNKEAFRKFSSSNSGPTTHNGYVKHTLVTHVEGVSSGMESNPATPLSTGVYSHTVKSPGSHFSVHDDPNAMNYAGDDMDFSSDAMENIDFSGIDVDHILGIPLPDAYMNPASGPPAQNQQNPPGNF